MKKKLFKWEIILFMIEVSLPVNTFLEMKTFPWLIAHNACMYNFWGFLKSHFVLSLGYLPDLLGERKSEFGESRCLDTLET